MTKEEGYKKFLEGISDGLSSIKHVDAITNPEEYQDIVRTFAGYCEEFLEAMNAPEPNVEKIVGEYA